MSQITVIVTFFVKDKDENSFMLKKIVKSFSCLQDAFNFISSLDYPPHKISIHFNIH